MVHEIRMYPCMYAQGTPRVGSRQASQNKLIWFTLLCYLLWSGDKIWNRNDTHESCDSVVTISVVSRETVSSASDVMSLLTMNDTSVNYSSSRCLPFFGENLADGGGLFRGEVRHANFEGTAVMSTLIFFPPKPFLILLSRKCIEQTFVISFSLNFVPTSLGIFWSHWTRRFGSLGKLKKPALFPLASTVPLWLQRGTHELIFELELIPSEISSQETVALKKSLLDDR